MVCVLQQPHVFPFLFLFAPRHGNSPEFPPAPRCVLPFLLALQGVGLIFSRPEVLFKLVMDLGKARSQWDLTFDRGSVIERIDENTDIIQVTFRRQVRQGSSFFFALHTTHAHAEHKTQSKSKLCPVSSLTSLFPAWLHQCSPQDFCLTRRWSCEPDGSFVVVLSSTEHTKVEKK